MCGLAGFVSRGGETADVLRASVRRMCDAIAHRGPDDAAEWIDAPAGVAMGFRRLAILDLSPAGRQPMTSASGRYVATLNGEIYNFEELRHTLERAGRAPAFRGHSDTEVMVAAFDAWGVAGAVSRFNGMFGIAVWDCDVKRLLLIRDRLGVKPLYYGLAGRTFLYGSELKALRQHPGFSGTIDRAALDQYLRFMYVPAPRSIYEGIKKLTPGTILSFDPMSSAVESTAYWSVPDAAAAGMTRRFDGSEEEAADAVDALVRDAVRLRMVADVPLGVFLSGGMDSSLVTALMQAQSAVPVRTFSIGFAETEYDESTYARDVAAHLGTSHTELRVTPQDAVAVIPRLASMYDEPFADSSQIPTHLVSALARRSVTVSLSGDGGDELFGGYRRYSIGARLFGSASRLPPGVRAAIGRGLGTLSPHAWDRVLRAGGSWISPALRPPHAGERIHKVARVLTASDADAMYFELVSHWNDLVIGGPAADASAAWRDAMPDLRDPVERMMFFDQMSYLPDDILAKVDRASMAVSLEVREPLLDYRLVEFAWTLPVAMKVRAGAGKPVLRRILRRHLPDALVDRPKMGFGLPIDQWLRGRLREWAESLLDASTIRSQGWLDERHVRAKWRAHLDGTAQWQYHLWAVLMFQAWLQEERTPHLARPRTAV
jgi:asparagine synthase (glutamine-hydrolysing)